MIESKLMHGKNEFSDILNETLTDLGFRRKSNYWYRNQLETINIVNLQKSKQDDTYFVNLGICGLNDCKDRIPKYDQFEMYARLEDFVPKEFLSSLPIENGIPIQVSPIAQIYDLRFEVSEGVTKFFNMTNTFREILDARDRGLFKAVLFKKSMLEKLNIQ